MRYDPDRPEDFFTCLKCGECCKGFGGTSLSGRDIRNISDYLGLTPERLAAEFCVRTGGSLQLDQKEDGYCIFWDGLCRIHPVKPRMCKAWPFIESVLIDPENWRIMAGFCPGINPDVPPDKLRECVRRQLAKLDESDSPLPVESLESGPLL